MKTLIKRRARNPRLGEGVFLWTGSRLEAGRVVGIYAAQNFHMEHFRIHLIDHDRLITCGRDDLALLPELRHLIPRMRRPSIAV
jgi:hypothetical protein